MTTTQAAPPVTDPNPFDTGQQIRGANVHGACSIQQFVSAGSLSHTHDDARGFLEYLNRFNPQNFWYGDGAVQYWQYTEPYDNWQNTYGADAVKVFYHSGHGGMAADGTFSAPLGGTWGGQSSINSTQMQIGDETLRYAYWSTCESLRVLGGHRPNRTWGGANRGIRMIFGWETVSWDYAHYGRKFWEHWKAGDTFLLAWLKSGWDGGRDQSPSATACGASADEAKNRVFNERNYYVQPVSDNWYWWAWWDAVRSAAPAGAPITAAPSDPVVLELGSVANVTADARRDVPTEVVHPGLARITLQGAGGSEPEPTARALAHNRVLAASDQVVDGLDLRGIELQPHSVRVLRTAGGTSDGSEQTAAMAAGYAVEYQQLIDGVPVVSPDGGYLRVFLDADGQPTTADLTARPVTAARAQGFNAPPDPDGGQLSLEQTVATALRAHELSDPVLSEPGNSVELLGDERETGYVATADGAHLATLQSYLVTDPSGYAKKVRIEVPLNQ